jgi:predicted ATPase/DNA-binding winged helix-turn-helix (wHTH) protein
MKSFLSFRLDESNQCLWRGDTRLALMPKPFAVLCYLVNHAGRLVTHEELLAAIWPKTFVQREVLRRYVLEIRRALGDQAEKPRFVETVPKRGYRFIAAVTEYPDIGSPVHTEAKLVGRDSALDQLDGYLRNSIHGHRQVVFISGETGIGKTALVDAFQLIAANIPTMRIVRGQCIEGFGGKEAYYPIFEALAELTRASSGEDVVANLARHAPTWIIQFPSLVRADQYASIKQQAIGATRDRMVRELCKALEVISENDALVIILEDLHWADHSTLDLLSATARRRQPAKLLILGTLRPADLILTRSPFKELRQDLLLHHLAFEVPIERLVESDVADYLGQRFGDPDFPKQLATVIHKRCDGNPLFMTAMLDHLVQQGVLSKAAGRWRMTIPLAQVDPGVPETLRQMLEVQLQHASAEEEQLLKCASVAGEFFTAWSVATMMPEHAADVDEQCAAAAERQLFLKAVRPYELPNGELTFEYQFRHSLYREVIYRRLSSAQRVNFHRLLAEGFEGLRSEPERDAAEIALHFEEGRKYERAVHYLMLAADNATRRYAHRESILALEHCRELLPKIAVERRSEFDARILEKLGDSYYALGDMEHSAATYHAMATRAAEAGLLTAQANALMRVAHSAEAIPFFLKAVELDSNFAIAYVSLSRIYSNLGEVELAKQYAKQAYELREHATERELLSILYQYHYEVTGDQTRATEILETWKRSFPDEFQPANSLALIHNLLGDFERAIEEGKEALIRNPSHGFPYSNLAHAYRGVGNFGEAQTTAEQAVEKNIATLPTRRLLYQLAILEDDQDDAKRHLECCRDKPREFEIVAARAQIAAFSGKLSEARQLYEQAAGMADARCLADAGSGHLAVATLIDLAFGNTEQARDGVRRVLARNPGYDPRLRAALTLAMTGSAEEAEATADEVTKANPEHTIINSVLAPIVRAGIALAKSRPAQAIEELRVAAPYEYGFCAVLAPLHLRAQAYLMLGSLPEAINEYERIIDHRGSDPFSLFYPAALVGLARTHALAGNKTASLRAYEQFLIEWSEADPNIPMLVTSRQEYDHLKSAPLGFAKPG